MSTQREAAKAEFWHKAAEIWKPDSENIVNIVEQGLGVVIEGKNGIGKSGLLLPQLEQEGLRRGYGVYSVDLRNESADASGLPRGGIFIGDEAGALVMRTHGGYTSLAGLRGLLGQIDSQDCLPILINAGIGRMRERTTRAVTMTSIVTSLRFEVVRLEPKGIPAGLAQEFLSGEGVRDDLIEFVGKPEAAPLLRPRMFGVITGQYEDLKPQQPVTGLEELRGFLGGPGVLEQCIVVCGIDRPEIKKMVTGLGI